MHDQKNPLIRSINLTKSYHGKKAVDNVDFAIDRGEIIGLVGPDGSGKTTLIRMLTSVLAPTSGDALIEGFSVKTDQKKILGKIGYVSQQFGLYSDLTVLENLNFFADIFGMKKKDKEKKIEALLAFSQLEQFKDFQADKLSGGMKQKLSLSSALIHNPEILFLDEPTNGVDPLSRRDFWNILSQLNRQGTTIFLSTSYLDEAERCSSILFLHNGKILAKGSLEELRSILKGDILEVKCSSPRKALLALKETFGGDVVKLFGNRIHIFLFTDNSPKTLLQVEEILIRLHLEGYSIKRTPPSLEDVFMALMTEEKDAS